MLLKWLRSHRIDCNKLRLLACTNSIDSMHTNKCKWVKYSGMASIQFQIVIIARLINDTDWDFFYLFTTQHESRVNSAINFRLNLTARMAIRTKLKCIEMVFKLATDEMREFAGERGGDRKQRMVSKECAVHEVKEKKTGMPSTFFR